MVDPAAAAVTVEVDGAQVATGTGEAVFGDPIKSIQWLAGHQELVGGPVRLSSLAFARVHCLSLTSNPQGFYKRSFDIMVFRWSRVF